MKRISILALSLLAAITSTARPQDRPGGGSKPSDTPRAFDQRAMYEDIEIMRRLLGSSLLNRSTVANQCASCHSPTPVFFELEGGSGTTHHAGMIGSRFRHADFDGWMSAHIKDYPHAGTIPLTVEGSYLKGHGVVFHLSMPAPGRDELTVNAPSPPAKPTSDWEQVRRQLRGEKSDAPAPSKKSTLTDTLLHVLAENGKNFGQLTANENLTIAVTFRDDAIRSRGMGAGAGPMSGAMGGMGGPGMGPGGMMAGAGGGGPPPGPAAGPPGPGPGGFGPPGAGALGPMGAGEIGLAGGGGEIGPITQDRELELLGDLHLKRGNLNDAVSAFERALAKARETRIDTQLPAAQARAAVDRANSRISDLARKLAEVHLKNGNLDAARKALDVRPIEVTFPDNKPGSGAVKNEAPAMKLPAKLIITVSKRALDQVGSGNISFADFQKTVSIEIPDLDPPRGKTR